MNSILFILHHYATMVNKQNNQSTALSLLECKRCSFTRFSYTIIYKYKVSDRMLLTFYITK